MHVLCLARAVNAFLLFALLSCAHAVELGEAQVHSHRGQPLSADIELSGIASGAATLQAGLASREVYDGANMAMHPVLSALKITLVERDGRRLLHLASSSVVETEFVNMFFELTENGHRVVRQSTLWLTLDPNSPPPPLTVPAPAPVPINAPPLASRRAPAFAAAIMASTPRAAPAACIQQFSAAEMDTCAALDGKNAELSAQIVELEEKVRRLSLALQAQAAQRPLITAMPALPANAVAGKAIRATPWRFIALAGAAVFLLIGVLVFFLLRNRSKVSDKLPGNGLPGWIVGIKGRLMSVTKMLKGPKKVEPTGE